MDATRDFMGCNSPEDLDDLPLLDHVVRLRECG
jgi:hypothetical protein